LVLNLRVAPVLRTARKRTVILGVREGAKERGKDGQSRRCFAAAAAMKTATIPAGLSFGTGIA
jgi:hypothetical protein